MSNVLSTVSGTVIAILVQEGTPVGASDDVVLIESMKMEIPVAADAAGVVREVRVAPGDVVAEGQVLVVLA
jgi:acetyl-CoA carboxylase biotin carboxyl carrier protein